MTASSLDPELKVGDGTVVTVEFWIISTDGEALDDSGGPVSFLHRGHDSLLPRLDDGIEGQQAGFDQVFHLEPDDAFGDYDTELLRVEPRERFPEPLEVGMRFEGVPGPEGQEDGPFVLDGDDEEPDDDALIFVVTDLTEDKVVLDANHPFAGMALRVRIKLLAVRPADPEEVEQGYADADDEGDDDELLDEMIEIRRNPGMLH